MLNFRRRVSYPLIGDNKMKLATIALVPLLAGYLGAQTSQSESKTTTTTNTVNLDGTLIDQSCYTKHTQTRETNSDANSTTTTRTEREETNCPVNASTTSFGLMTPDGKVVHFDDASNARVVEMLKTDKEWQDDVNGHKPVKVRVVAMPNGDMMVIKEIK